MLWHRSGSFAIPNLAYAGGGSGAWKPIELETAQLAFGDSGGAVIAVRSACGEDQAPLDVASRHLWLGLPREDRERRHIEVAGLPAIETVGFSDGVRIQTVVLETGTCTLDLAYAALQGQAADAVFEGFLRRVQVRPER